MSSTPPNPLAQQTRDSQFSSQFGRHWSRAADHRRDMKLHSILLGWTGFLTKPCVSPQVFQGSTRPSGCGWVATTVGGVEPSRKCIKPGSLKPG